MAPTDQPSVEYHGPNFTYTQLDPTEILGGIATSIVQATILMKRDAEREKLAPLTSELEKLGIVLKTRTAAAGIAAEDLDAVTGQDALQAPGLRLTERAARFAALGVVQKYLEKRTSAEEEADLQKEYAQAMSGQQVEPINFVLLRAGIFTSRELFGNSLSLEKQVSADRRWKKFLGQSLVRMHERQMPEDMLRRAKRRYFPRPKKNL